MHDPAGDAAMWEGAVRGIGCVAFLVLSFFVVAVAWYFAERARERVTRRPIVTIPPRRKRKS
jgi:hypothetical protein